MDNYIKEIANNLDFKNNEFITINNNFLITNKEKTVLDNYNINYRNCNSLKELIFLLEDAIDEYDYPDELMEIADMIAERDYYINTNK